ncbi:hypothetical protein BH20VER3_BH20VER3_21480 [soil metagenome]
MRLESLVHVVRVASAITPGRRIVILGSSSLLGSFPELGDETGPLETSFDADLLIEGVDEQLAAVLEEAIGMESLFKAREGYFADTLRPTVTETFPRGWEARLVSLPGCEAASCLDPHDLAAVKMQTGREKDFVLCAELLAMGRLRSDLIDERLQETRMTERMMVLSSQRLQQTIEMAKDAAARNNPPGSSSHGG